jgi:gliding motility-associated-like protein
MFSNPNARRVMTALIFIISVSSSVSAAGYFWVGGDGNWSDISHWATTSGGGATHAQAPTANDDVYFDANSFSGPLQMVRLNTDVNFCRSMSWAGATGNPVFLGGRSVSLNVFGSLELINAMDYRFDGTVVFTGETDNNVDFRGNTAGYVLAFTGTGAWSLTGDVAVDSILLFNEGTLRTSGRAVTTKYLRSDGNATRTLELGASNITITANTWRPYPNSYPTFNSQPLWIDARNLTLDAGTSTINLTGSQVDVFLEGPGSIAFNEVVFSAVAGASTIRHWTDQNGFEPTVSFTRLNLLNRTLLEGSFTIDELELHGGQQYRFQSGETFTLGNLIANGDCQGTVDLSGTAAANPAIFSAAGPITADYTSLRAISATGGGTFTANNTIDLGNNSGWTLNDRPNETFFWIGDNGNWNNPNNWSFSSGGPPNSCLPSLADDVFFDGGSFAGTNRTVTIDVENAACRNMDWTGANFNPTFAGSKRNRMQIGGSLTFIPSMNHTFEGSYIFSSNQPGNTITSARQRLNLNATFEGGGEWILQDSFNVYFELNVQSGIFRTNDQPINANFFYSRNADPREIYLGDSRITIESRQDSFFYCEMNLRSQNLVFDAGSSIIDLQGSYGGSVVANGEDNLVFNVINFYVPYGSFYQSIVDPALNPTVMVDSMAFYNTGFISGYNEMNYLYLAPGRHYELRTGEELIVNELIANGSCEDGTTSIVSSFPDETASLSLPIGQIFERLYLRDIELTAGAPAVANVSIDGLGNTGWQITEETGRTLFWVGGEGEWFDPTHWSLNSGGAGGECIPTLIDNVIVDGNSSTAIDFSIFNNSDRYTNCYDISWTPGLTDINYFNVRRMRIAGSFTNEGNLNFGASPVYYLGTADHTITMGNARFFDFIFEQTGTYAFLDDFLGYGITHQRGTVNFTDQTGDLELLTIVSSPNPKFMNLGDAHLRLSYNYDGFTGAFSAYGAANVTIDPGNSLVELTSTSGTIRADYGVAFNDVLFSNPAGNGLIIQEEFGTSSVLASSVVFNGNGRLDLELITDTLIFAPGKSYTFKADADQTINKYWQTIGNNCTPIALQSSINGTQARAQVPAEGKIIADFVQMRDITGVGGADFLAGSRSTDIGNSNINWRFETAPQFQTVGFLGQDRAICEGEDVVLSAFNFSPGEQYLWQDGSTDTTFTTSQSGTYFVEVAFQNNCLIRDTIVVLDAQAFEVDLPDDPIICQGDTLVLSADAGLNSANYLWQDGSTEPTFSAFASGSYKVTVDLGGCLKSDSTILTVLPSPTIELGDERVVACAGEDFTLTATVTADNLMWQDGSTGMTFTGDQAGIYYVEASNGQCTVRDSVEVVYVTPNTVSLGNDSTLCIADDLLLDAGNPGYGYLWQDGSTGQTLTATADGQYFVTIDSAGCTSSDTINLSFPSPTVDLGNDRVVACAGEEFTLTATVSANSFMWQDGSMGTTFTGDQAGIYYVEASDGQCTVRDSVEVVYVTLNTVSLGNDSTLCVADDLLLDAGNPGHGYLWQDGSTGQTFNATATGQYFVTIDSAGCTSNDTINLTFPRFDDLDVVDGYEICAGETFRLTTQIPADEVRWSNGQIGSDFSTTTGGAFMVEFDFGPCTLTKDFVVDFLALPTINLGPDVTECEGIPVMLDAGISGMWQDGSVSPTFSTLAAGQFKVIVTDGPCVVADSVNVAFLDAPDFSLGDDQGACEGDQLMVSVSPATLGLITWDDGEMDVTRSFTDTGLRFVDVEDDNGCIARDSVQLTFNAPPVLNLGLDTTVCEDEPFTLMPAAGPGNFTWPDGSNGPTYLVSAPGTIRVALEDDFCRVTDTVNVAFMSCIKFDDYLPTAFSPNFDGINDEFGLMYNDRVEILDYTMEVFDRWGSPVFRSENINDRWDGTKNGEVVDLGVFVYVIEVTFLDDRETGFRVISGDVMVVR